MNEKQQTNAAKIYFTRNPFVLSERKGTIKVVKIHNYIFIHT